MQLKTLIDNIHERCRASAPASDKNYRPGIAKADVAAVLHHLGQAVLEEILLKADRVNLPGMGQAHAEWLGKNGGKQLYAQFDWAQSVEKRILEARP